MALITLTRVDWQLGDSHRRSFTFNPDRIVGTDQVRSPSRSSPVTRVTLDDGSVVRVQESPTEIRRQTKITRGEL